MLIPIRGQFVEHRDEIEASIGGGVTPDPAVSGVFPVRADLIDARWWETLIGKVTLTGGVAPTIEVTPIIYDSLTDSFGYHVATGALADGDAFEIACVGLPTFLLITAVAGIPEEVVIRITTGQRIS